MNAFRTIIIPASLAPRARILAAALAEAGGGMFTTALSANGLAPASHYISSGLINDSFTAMLTNADLLHAACTAAGATVTMAQCQDLVAQSTVSDGTRTVVIDGVSTVVNEDPHALLARLGLKINQGTE